MSDKVQVRLTDETGESVTADRVLHETEDGQAYVQLQGERVAVGVAEDGVYEPIGMLPKEEDKPVETEKLTRPKRKGTPHRIR